MIVPVAATTHCQVEHSAVTLRSAALNELPCAASVHHFFPQMTSSWSEQEVALWLQEQGFGEFEDAFVSNNIDGRAIVNLSKEDLEDLGVKAIGKRAALVAAIVECFGKCAANKVEAAAAPAPIASTWEAQPAQHQPAEAGENSHLAQERIKLFIGGLTDGISKDMLHQELQQHAPVDEVIVLMNPSTGTTKGSGFAFVVGKKNADTLMYVPSPFPIPSPSLVCHAGVLWNVPTARDGVVIRA